MESRTITRSPRSTPIGEGTQSAEAHATPTSGSPTTVPGTVTGPVRYRYWCQRRDHIDLDRTVQWRIGHHRLQDLPRLVSGSETSPDDNGPGHVVHQHRTDERGDLLLQGLRGQRDRYRGHERRGHDAGTDHGTTATVPGAVTGLTATATGASGVIKLTWTAPSNGGSAITGYKIYQSTVSGSETLLATIGPVTSYTNTGLTNGVTYYYKVSAVNAIGEGVQSAEVLRSTDHGTDHHHGSRSGNRTIRDRYRCQRA